MQTIINRHNKSLLQTVKIYSRLAMPRYFDVISIILSGSNPPSGVRQFSERCVIFYGAVADKTPDVCKML